MKMGRDFEDFPWLLAHAETVEDHEKIRQIQEDHWSVFQEGVLPEGDELFSVRLMGLTVWFRRRSAYSSVEIFTEIFKYRAHMAAPGFDGTHAKHIVDLGACEGFYTLKLLTQNPTCQVLAVEPHPETFEVLSRNIRSNFPHRAVLVQKAIGATEGFRTLEYVPQIPAITAFHLERPWLPTQWKRQTTVQVITLPQLLEQTGWSHIDLLKMDIEGAEVEALQGARPIFHRIDRMVIEYHGSDLREEILELLAPWFECVHEESRPEGSPFGDLYFVRRG